MGGRGAVLALTIVALTGCGGADPEQLRACRALIDAFEPPAAQVEIGRQHAVAGAPNTVRIDYTVTDGGGLARAHWVRCGFAGGTLARDRLALTEVATDREGVFSDVKLHLLRRWLGMFDARGRAGRGGDRAVSDLAYAAQQLVNALVSCCVYGILATAYTMVYAIIGRINLAYGALAMIGGFATFLGVTALGGTALPLGLALLAALALAATVGAGHGWAIARLVFRPLAGVQTQAALVATLGLAVFLQEYVRLVQGSRDRWLQPVLSARIGMVVDGTPIMVSVAQLAILLLTAAICAGLWWLMRRTRFGFRQRACIDDPGMAAMLGVDVDRTVAATVALGGACAAIAGAVVTLYYGGVHAYMGHLVGFKALAAAIVGGIGSIAGAMMGGILIGLLETFWSGYLTIAYKDVAVFGVLAAVLIFRPGGLIDRSAARGD